MRVSTRLQDPTHSPQKSSGWKTSPSRRTWRICMWRACRIKFITWKWSSNYSRKKKLLNIVRLISLKLSLVMASPSMKTFWPWRMGLITTNFRLKRKFKTFKTKKGKDKESSRVSPSKLTSCQSKSIRKKNSSKRVWRHSLISLTIKLRKRLL